MTVVLFLVVLFVLILVHELGHFVVAKWARMQVDEFAIGFPPRLFSIKRGETEYSINLLPIGGYVKILGENGTEEETVARNSSRSFTARPRFHQAAVLIAGVTMNILIAWLIFFAVAMIGVPTAVDDTRAASAELTIVSIADNSPAAKANLPAGAIVYQAEAGDERVGLRVPSDLTTFVQNHGDETISLSYRYKNEARVARLKVETGIVPNEPDRQAIGVSTVLVETVQESPGQALVSATVRTIDSLYAITIGIISFLATAFTFSADLSQVSGPVGIAGLLGEAAEFGIVSVLTFTAFISLNLAIINLLPIPALDGGRLLFVIIEAIIRKPINPEWMTRVNFIGFSLLIGLMIAVTYNDIVKLV